MKAPGQPASDPADARRRLARFALSLFQPALPPGPVDDPPEWLLDELAAFFAANQLAFLSLPHSPATARLPQRPALAEALQAESDRFARLRAEFESVRLAWQQAGVEPVLIKAGAGIPSFPHLSGNLDVYVPPHAAESADAVLYRLGFVELPLLREPNKFLYKLFRQGDEACAIHLHLRVEWCVSFLFEDRLWSRRQVAPDDPRLVVPPPEEALLVTLAHALYENKRFTLGELLKVSRCLAGPDLDWEYVWSVAESKGWGAGLAYALLVHDRLARNLGDVTALPHVQTDRCRRRLRGLHRRWAARRLNRPERLPFPAGFVFSKALFFAKTLGDRTELCGGRVRSALYHLLTGTRLKLRLQAQQRFLVSFSGIDGSGKSTVARAVQRALEQCGIRTRYVWSRGGSSGLAGTLVAGGKRLLGTFSPPPEDLPRGATPAFIETRRAELFRRPLVRALWPWLVLIDLAWTYTRKVRLPLLLGRVVLCDRYVADAVAELGSRLRHQAVPNTLPARLLRMLSPKPDAAIYLAVAPETARRRQAPQTRQGTPELAERQATLLDRMVGEGELTRFDGQLPLEEVTDRVVREVLRRVFAGCRPWARGLLGRGFEPASAAGADPFEPTRAPTPMPSAPAGTGRGDEGHE